MVTPSSTLCSSCGAPINTGDVSEGLAVRIDGRLICPLCVDTLPGTAQVKINQLRAMRGLDVTTYRVPRAAHPTLRAYTFTTSTQLHQHRRVLAASGRFEAPTIPTDHKPILKMAPASRQAPSTRNPLVLVGISVAAVILVVITIGLTVGGTSPAKPVVTDPVPVLTEKQRTDYPPSARDAWLAASSDPGCPRTLLAAIARELVTELDGSLDAIEGLVKAKDPRGAAEGLAAIEVPDDIRFRAVTNRVNSLTQRIAAARSSAAGSPPTPPPTPPGGAPEIAAPAVSAVTPTTTPAQPAALFAWIIPAQAMHERAGQNAWRSLGATGRRLLTSEGTIGGTFRIDAGIYRCWLRVAPSEDADCTIHVIVDGRKSTFLRLVRATPIDWYPIDIPDLAVLHPEAPIQITVIGQGSTVESLFLESPTGSGPRDAVLSGRAQQPALVSKSEPAPTPPGVLPGGDPGAVGPTPTEPIGTAPKVSEPQPPAPVLPVPLALTDFTHKVVEWDPLELPSNPRRDDADDARYTYPDHGGPYILSELQRRSGTNHVAIRFSEPVPPGSGVGLLVHPRRLDREELVAIFNDQAGGTAKVVCPLSGMQWTPVLVLAPANRSPWVSMRLEDVKSASTEFLVGKTIVTPGRPVTVDDFGLAPRSLLTPTYSELLKLIGIASEPRQQKNPRWLEVAQVKILVTDRMTAGNWTTTVRAGLKEIFKEVWKGDDAPNKTTEKLVLHDQWLDEVYGKDPAKSIVNPTAQHVLVILTAGNELQAGLTVEQAVKNFWLPFIERSLENGVIPVAVLGPSRVDVDKREDADTLWTLLDQELARKRIAIPKIDLRPARSISIQRMESGHAQLASDRLCAALAEFRQRVERLQGPR